MDGHVYNLLLCNICLNFLKPVGKHIYHTLYQMKNKFVQCQLLVSRCSYNKNQRDALISQIYFWNGTVRVLLTAC